MRSGNISTDVLQTNQSPYWFVPLETTFKGLGVAPAFDEMVTNSDWGAGPRACAASYLTLVDKFISEKGQNAREHYYWKNAAAAYRLPLE